MNLITDDNEFYQALLEDLEESILVWQKYIKDRNNDKRFNARKFLADKLQYKDSKILYKFLDPNDNSNAKLGVEDLQIIIETTGDITPLENYLDALKKK